MLNTMKNSRSMKIIKQFISENTNTMILPRTNEKQRKY